MTERKRRGPALGARLLSLGVTLFVGPWLVACGGATPAPASPRAAEPAPVDVGAPTTATPSAKAGDPFVLGAPLEDDPPVAKELKAPDLAAWTSAADVPGVPAAPASCVAFVQRKASKKAPACEEKGAAMLALADALDQVDVAGRDSALVALEGCGGLPKGAVRALRADLAPPECGDKIVDPWIASSAKATPNPILHALVGQSLGARLARTVGTAPSMKGAADKKHVLAYVAGPLRAWIEGQARAVESLSRAASGLATYGRGVAAVEAGLADMRFVERAREVPLPKEFEADPELKTVYYATLDQALDPRKDRGRDAALVGLRELASLGIVQDARVARARALLGRLYAGRRIDALDALLLPALPAPSKVTVEERLAAKLPTFYAPLVLGDATLREPNVLRASLGQGVPPTLRETPNSDARPTAATELVYAGGRALLGKTYFRAVDFDVAARAANPSRTVNKDGAPSAADMDAATLLVALGVAFHEGPRDAVALMQAPSPAALGLRNVAALDAVRGAYQGAAAFDAALLLSIAPPEGANKGYFADVARRFHAAAALLQGADRGAAEERARAADEIAKAAP